MLFIGVEAAMNWVFEHSQDADFSAPLQVNPSQGQVFQADPTAIAMIASMGFTESQARKALEKTVSEYFALIYCASVVFLINFTQNPKLFGIVNDIVSPMTYRVYKICGIGI